MNDDDDKPFADTKEKKKAILDTNRDQRQGEGTRERQEVISRGHKDTENTRQHGYVTSDVTKEAHWWLKNQ